MKSAAASLTLLVALAVALPVGAQEIPVEEPEIAPAASFGFDVIVGPAFRSWRDNLPFAAEPSTGYGAMAAGLAGFRIGSPRLDTGTRAGLLVTLSGGPAFPGVTGFSGYVGPQMSFYYQKTLLYASVGGSAHQYRQGSATTTVYGYGLSLGLGLALRERFGIYVLFEQAVLDNASGPRSSYTGASLAFAFFTPYTARAR